MIIKGFGSPKFSGTVTIVAGGLTVTAGGATITGDVGISSRLGVGTTAPGSGNGAFIQSTSTNNAISTGSQGAGTTALFIGNAQITAVSDVRIKDNIKPTTINATDLILRTPVVEHTWNHPEDSAPVNKNSRGPWVGITAQDLIKTMPWLVNAEDRTCQKCLDGQACDEHKSLWQVDFDYMTAVLAKGFQELEGRVRTLESH